ncbi:MAG: mannonate dehydratase [Oceanicoccus sp.]
MSECDSPKQIFYDKESTMQQTWRWFGPNDPVPLDHIRQAGAQGIVTSLHHIPTGDVWSDQDIVQRKHEIEGENDTKAPLLWSVVESVNVHDDIKVAAPGHEKYVAAYCETLRALGRNGIRTVCYNFMPLIDWTRTSLNHQLASGAATLYFDADKFAAFDLFILQRAFAENDYTNEAYRRAKLSFEEMSVVDKEQLVKTILTGLPGSTTGEHSLDSFRQSLKRYNGINDEQLRINLINFLQQIVPVAIEAGVNLAIHPDDPPRRLLGLPRVICCAEDLRKIFAAVSAPANGLTLCAGTFGVRADNDLPLMAQEFSDRVYFAHLRGTKRATNPLSFQEADHLDSDVDMLGLIAALMNEEERRSKSGEPLSIPIRPDHGHRMLDDLEKDGANPGYTAIGRLKGLAEIRGAIAAFSYVRKNLEQGNETAVTS